MKQYVYADMDDIVFENREKDYGAFTMRRQYNRYLSRAMLITFLLFISITALPKVIDWMTPPMPEEPEEIVQIVPVDLDLPPDTPDKPDEPEVTPPPPPKRPKVRTIRFVIPTPAPDDMVVDEEPIFENDDLDSAAIALVTQDGEDGLNVNYDFDAIGNGDDSWMDDVTLDGDDGEIPIDSFIILEEEPRPVNMDDLKDMIGYPEMAIQAEIEGKVVMRVYIDKMGNYIKHKVVNVAPPILILAVEKHIHHLKMTPGIQGNKPIKVWVTVPFNFTLKK